MTSVVLGEDAARVYLYKPAGLPVFPPHADPAGDCLLARWLAAGGGAEGWPAGFEGGIAHRLDTATSGLVVAARTPADLVRLREEFSSGKLRKIYSFHTSGVVEWTDQTVTLPIAHHERKKDRMIVQRGPCDRHRGRWYPAWTRFTARGGPWWQAEIRTGVMHQIRVHAAAVGIALTGDRIYGGAEGEFVLVHERIVGPGWASPAITPPEPR